ncbi:hypothetical protein V1460_04790 [Streptomyces sp. SCSIO 30461]|uniref:hypothetical protein n=1 Tax=Streptomyces sp. SCSIO 30461 TaxID=3118085 RepID=UPI0030D5ADC0
MPTTHAPARLKRTGAALLTTTLTAAALTLTACLPSGAEGKTRAGASAEKPGPYAGLSGAELLNKSFKATKRAKSLTLQVDTRTADGPEKAYLSVSAKGDCTGTVSLGTAGTTEFIRTGGTVYMRFDEVMLREQVKGMSDEETEAVMRTLRGKWVEYDADADDARDLVELCDLDSHLGALVPDDNVARRAGESTVNGTPTVVVTEQDGREKYTVHVSAKGIPFLARIETTGGDDPGTITFSQFDEPVVARKPAAKDIADID